MCLIVDANVAAKFFCTEDASTEDLRKAVFGKGCCVVYGGHLRVEYGRMDEVRKRILALDRAGKARAVADAKVNQRAEHWRNSGLLKSDDPHIVALAEVSGSRLLHSRDEALSNDFKNPKVINNPRGKVYRGGKTQKHLVNKFCTGC